MHAVDLGCGSGVLAMMLANAGAENVVAVEAHNTVCQIARKNISLNGLGKKVARRSEDVF